MLIKDIDACTCLCLDKRFEQWKKIWGESLFGLNIKPFICGNGQGKFIYDYVDDPHLSKLDNAFNCWKLIFGRLSRDSIKCALLMEDDFYLTKDFIEGLATVDYNSFDICPLGSYSEPLMNERDVNFRLVSTIPTYGFAGFHGILVKSTVFNHFLNNENNPGPIDVIFGHHNNFIQRNFTTKLLSPSIILQEPMFSEISKAMPASHSGLQLAWNAARDNNRI